MKPVMYVFLNKGAKMSVGKAAAQAGHAAHLSAVWSRAITPEVYAEYMLGQHYTKLIMEAEDETHLFAIQKYIDERGFQTFPIIDEGRTEVRPFTFTALGVQIVDKDDLHTLATFSSFRTYRDNHQHNKPTNQSKLRRKWHGLLHRG